MEKKQFENVVIEIQNFDVFDVIVTSGVTENSGNHDWSNPPDAVL